MGDLSLELTAALDAPQCAREAISAELGSHLSPDRLRALQLIVSELVTNSVKHGPGGPIHLRIRVSEDGTVLGRIEDEGRGPVTVREDVDPAEGGVGLKLVDAITDRWGVENGTTNVWFELAARRFGRVAY